MDRAPHLRRQLRAVLTLTIALAIWAPSLAHAAEPADPKAKSEDPMMAQCEEMKAQKQKMKDDAHAQDAALTESIARMNGAPLDEKVTAMAAIITHMTEQRIAMDARKDKMEEEMMKHMMEHMQKGKESMAKCSMMKDMKDKDAKPGDEHAAHH